MFSLTNLSESDVYYKDFRFIFSQLPEEIEDIRYCVLDVTDKQEPDFFFIPLVFIEKSLNKN